MIAEPLPQQFCVGTFYKQMVNIFTMQTAKGTVSCSSQAKKGQTVQRVVQNFILKVPSVSMSGSLSVCQIYFFPQFRLDQRELALERCLRRWNVVIISEDYIIDLLGV